MAIDAETGSRSTTAERSSRRRAARSSSISRRAARGSRDRSAAVCEGSGRPHIDGRVVGRPDVPSAPTCSSAPPLPRSGLALGSMLMAFCVQHDANHGAFFRRRRYNHLLGWTSDALLGFSSYAWRVKHNVAHHTYTNVDGFDDDVKQVPLARFAPSPAEALVPLPAPLHLADVHADGACAGSSSATSQRSPRSDRRSARRTPRGWNLAGVSRARRSSSPGRS